MIPAQINNPFAVGDLVHIPQGTTLYKILKTKNNTHIENPTPSKITDIPTIGLVINKSIYDFYLVDINSKEYLIKAEELCHNNGNIKYAY